MAEGDDREERHVRALARSLRRAIEQGAPDDRLNQLTRAAMGAGGSPGMAAAFRAWLGAQARYQAVSPDAPGAEALRGEMDQLWAAYESAVDAEDGGGGSPRG